MTPDKVEAALGAIRWFTNHSDTPPGMTATQALSVLTEALAERDWRHVSSAPTDSRVVLFCDSRGNRWTQCANAWDIPVCGLSASFWQPLPEPPHAR